MLENINFNSMMMKEDYQKVSGPLKERLSAMQQTLKQAGLPVILLFEGWGASGKGSFLTDIVSQLDPRGFKVYNTVEPIGDEARHPWLWRYWSKIPERGLISLFDRGWYHDLSTDIVDNGRGLLALPAMYADVNTFERQLADDGYLILKFFLHIPKDVQKKRFNALEAKKSTKWRVTKKDWAHHEQYNDYFEVFDRMISNTDTDSAPWHIVPTVDRRMARFNIFTTILEQCEKALAVKAAPPLSDNQPDLDSPIAIPRRFTLSSVPALCDIDLSKSLTREEYKTALKKEQERLGTFQNMLYAKRIPLIIVYEGWDAAGKGGNIKRVVGALDCRGYEVIPIAAPTPPEKNRHFLYRFWNALPKTGHTAIFDRSWYGRVMVERVEGFCPPSDWRRAFTEINEFEYILTRSGAIMIKLWLQIDKDTQLARFNERMETPEKRWKITDEDWRNREKWDDYEVAVNDMLRYTSTEFAPWTIIESNDKCYARIKALRTINSVIAARCVPAHGNYRPATARTGRECTSFSHGCR